MHLVMLSGGSGRRLWPLSNDLYSKQFIKVIKNDVVVAEQGHDIRCSMLQRVYAQLKACHLSQDLVIVANNAQMDLIEGQLGKDVEVIPEPSRRDTMPAILLACSWLKSEKGICDEDYVAVIPVDSYTELSFYHSMIKLETILKETGLEFGLMGAVPTYPSEKYGYLISWAGDAKDEYIKVKGFKEKPDSKTAEDLILQGALWNCGVVCFKLSTISKYMKMLALPLSYKDLLEQYDQIPAISFDYGVLEKNTKLAALKYNGMWKDLGTWNTLTEEMQDNIEGEIIWDSSCKGIHAINKIDIPMVIMGVTDLVVVASHDGILVADKKKSSYLKDQIKDMNFHPRFEEHQWGIIITIDLIDKDKGGFVKTNKVKVFRGNSVSYYLHHSYDIVITIINGTGILILEGKKIELSPGVSCPFSAKYFRSIEAVETLEYIEIVIGQYRN